MTATTRRLDASLAVLAGQMRRAGEAGARHLVAGRRCEAALEYTRACALASALAHVWEGLVGADRPEAAPYRDLQGHYATQAGACRDAIEDADRAARRAAPRATDYGCTHIWNYAPTCCECGVVAPDA